MVLEGFEEGFGRARIEGGDEGGSFFVEVAGEVGFKSGRVREA